MNLEESLKDIEKIAEKLENPDLGMDEGLKLYEQGVELVKDCLSQLNEVKGKINIIKKDLDAYKEEPLD